MSQKKINFFQIWNQAKKNLSIVGKTPKGSDDYTRVKAEYDKLLKVEEEKMSKVVVKKPKKAAAIKQKK